MNITGPVRSLILDNSAAVALLGTKVYPVALPQETVPPYACIGILNNATSPCKGAVSPVDFVTFAVSTYAQRYDYAQQADDAIRAGVDGYRGVVTVGGDLFAFDAIEYLDTTDGFQPESALYIRSSQYRVRWLRTATSVSPGPSLPNASPDTINVSSGEALSSGRVVILDGEEAFYFQPTNSAHAGRAVGVTRTSAAGAGVIVTVQISGIVSDLAFTFAADSGLYAIANGAITSTKPSSGTIQYVGVATAANTMKIEFTDTLQNT